MLHPKYLKEGAEITIPEIADAISLSGGTFIVRGVHEGGMGICIHLYHQNSGAEYAIKSVRPELIGDAPNRDRFLDELQVWIAASACAFVAEALSVVCINHMPS